MGIGDRDGAMGERRAKWVEGGIAINAAMDETFTGERTLETTFPSVKQVSRIFQIPRFPPRHCLIAG